jgi:hypothetical protein
MGWLIALGILTGLAILPLGFSAVYNMDGPRLRLIIGPFRLLVYPRKKKVRKPQKEAKSAQKPAAKKPKETGEKGGSIKDFMPLLRIVLDFVGSFRRKLRINVLQMKLILAGGDPCDLAVNYGRAWTALGNLMPLLERSFVIRKRDVEVECDFTSSETCVFARVDLTITLGRVLSISLYHGFRAVREYLNILKIRKGGAKL